MPLITPFAGVLNALDHATDDVSNRTDTSPCARSPTAWVNATDDVLTRLDPPSMTSAIAGISPPPPHRSRG